MRQLWAIFLLLLGCTDPTEPQSERSAPNILVILGDDMGVETLSAYDIGTPTAVTPNLDQLAARGMRFERFWSQAACSPTRAAILTGRYGFRTGVVTPLFYGWSKMDPAIVPQPSVPAGSPREIDFTPRAPVPDGVDFTMSSLPPTFPTPKGPANDELMLPACQIRDCSDRQMAFGGFSQRQPEASESCWLRLLFRHGVWQSEKLLCVAARGKRPIISGDRVCRLTDDR